MAGDSFTSTGNVIAFAFGWPGAFEPSKDPEEAIRAMLVPRVLKVHEDRSFRDIISFGELQEMAQRCLEMPDDGEQEEKSWLRRLRGYEHLVDRSRTSSPIDDAISVADICASRQSNRQQEKLGTAVESQCLDNISLGASKRKISPEIALYGNLTIKRAKQE
ncbi:hypothetical protein B0J13DRAFT_680887 [Dactylonectria estremocensis]|uniref:Uncharacterized protein n=1 Tax=Dactylonectria estremocensis TaxID=1079267 RepID=A0A9P9DHU4_9HYPO|nr:hypothetical protein B0J13DRAFT_680887 [Dactylonectria estremocensis]